jgi:hypothetical protein
LLTGLTKTVLETALEAEMSEHLGYERHDPVGRDGANSRNGTRTLRTGEPVDIRLKARRRTADVTVTTDEAGVVADYWPATTTSSPGSTASGSTQRANPMRVTCASAGPRADGACGSSRADPATAAPPAGARPWPHR